MSDVMRMFREHSEMILEEEHIACFMVNWNNKADNIRRIAETLNIGLDSMVFIVDFSHDCFSIRHTVTTCRTKGEKVVVKKDRAKNKSSRRTYPMISFIKERLLEAKKQQDENKRLYGRSYNKENIGYICVDAVGDLIKPNYVSGTFPKLLAKNNLRHIRFHDLRHSCASLLLANGVPLKQIQEWLGHSDFAITANTYAHLEFNSKVASANAMTWIDRTSMAKELPHVEQPALLVPASDLQSRLSDVINSLLTSGAPVELIAEWLKQEDLATADDLQQHFAAFMAASASAPNG